MIKEEWSYVCLHFGDVVIDANGKLDFSAMWRSGSVVDLRSVCPRTWFQSLSKILNSNYLTEYWPRGYKTFFMLNSTEHEISTVHKN